MRDSMADFLKSTELGFAPVNTVISILKTSFRIVAVGTILIAILSLIQFTQVKRTPNAAAPKKALEISQIR